MEKKKIRARDVSLIKKYLKYRKAGLSYGELQGIKIFAKKDPKQFRRWNEYIKRGLFELSTISGDSTLAR